MFPKPLRLKVISTQHCWRIFKGGQFFAFENDTQRKCNAVVKKYNWLILLQFKRIMIILNFVHKLKLSSLKQHHKLQWLWRHLASNCLGDACFVLFCFTL